MTDSPAARVKGKHLTDINIAKILGLAKGLIPQRAIESLMNCSQKAVHHTLATYFLETFRGHNPWREYQHKTPQREYRYIERALKQNNSLPLRNLTNIIGLPISERSIRHWGSEAGLESYIAAENPGLYVESIAKKIGVGTEI